MYSPYDKIFEPDALELILPTNNSESLWDSRELIMKAIKEQNKLIREEYEKPKETSKEAIKDKE